MKPLPLQDPTYHAKICQPAQIVWKGRHAFNPLYQDHYSSTSELPEAALTECHQVFVDPTLHFHNQTKNLTIFEVGFGLGLNFFTTMAKWQTLRQPGSHCHYIAVEKHPVIACDFNTLSQHYPSLAPLINNFIALIPPLISGLHTRFFFGQGMSLTLYHGELSDFIVSHSPLSIDAFYLDGFSPSKNQDAWAGNVFNWMAQQSHGKTTVCSYSVATAVKEGLSQAGFSIEKRPGVGKKKSVLFARYQNSDEAINQNNQVPQPNHLVIGAGISGSTTALLLHHTNQAVTWFEQGAKNGCTANNPIALLHPKIISDKGFHQSFQLASFHHAKAFYRAIEIAYSVQLLHKHPTYHFAHDTNSKKKIDKYPETDLLTPYSHLSQSEANQHARTNITADALYCDDAYIIDCDAMYQVIKEIVPCQYKQSLESIEPEQNMATINQIQHRYRYLFLCHSFDLLEQFDSPIFPIAGQLSACRAKSMQSTPNAIIRHQQFITPAINGQVYFGATFHRHQSAIEVSHEDHYWNNQIFKALKQTAPEPESLKGYAGLRCQTPDRLPIIGPMVNQTLLMPYLKALHRNANHSLESEPPYYHNIMLNHAHGASGWSTGPWAAWQNLCTVFNWPKNEALLKPLSSERFLIRQAQKQLLF